MRVLNSDSIASFPKAEVEVKVEVIPKSLQLQVQEEVPKFRRIARSNTKKVESSKEKRRVTVNLDPTKAEASLKQSPTSIMANNTLDPQKSPDNIGS